MLLYRKLSLTELTVDIVRVLQVVLQFLCGKSRIMTSVTSCNCLIISRIYGGGYTIGSKSGSGDPGGLIRASQADGSSGIIFVAMNYRLGAIGWLAGPTLQAAGGVSNAGLYDQRLAIEWVASNIHLFGGDPNQITLIGESAGGKTQTIAMASLVTPYMLYT